MSAKNPQMPRRRGARDAKGTLLRIWSYISDGYKARFIIVLICLALSSCAMASGSMVLMTLVDGYIKPMMTEVSPDFSGLLRAIILLACIYLIGTAASFTYNRIMVVIAQGVLKRVRDRMFDHMQTLPLRYFDSHTHGDIMSHYTNDTDTLRQLISQSIPSLCSSALTIVVVLGCMIYLSPILTLIVLLFVCLKLYVAKTVGGGSARFFVKHQKALGDLNGYIEEMINGQKVVKVFCHEDKSKDAFDSLNETLCSNAASANTYGNIMMPIMGNIGHLLYVTVAAVGGALAISGVGGLTLGMMVSFLQLCRNFNMPINQASQQISFIAMALAGAERIFDLIDEPSETDGGFVTLVNAKYSDTGELTEAEEHTGIWAWKRPVEDGGFSYTLLQGDVRFFNVDFGYVPEKKIVLHNISLYAKPGQKLAFVGNTGAGKTTITNLINRFYDINDGEILYDGINIGEIRKPDLRRSLGIVLQDTNLFTGTVMDNIRYGRLDATDEECIEAAKLANAHGFISMLKDGYNTMLSGGGAELSQGQRQLVSIARCAVADPPVMILDEATSSIDTRTEAIVQRGMDKLMHGRTVFVIAHRLSTVRNSNAIIVLSDGHIIERGDHEQLLAERGTYYNLYTGAFELE